MTKGYKEEVSVTLTSLDEAYDKLMNVGLKFIRRTAKYCLDNSKAFRKGIMELWLKVQEKVEFSEDLDALLPLAVSEYSAINVSHYGSICRSLKVAEKYLQSPRDLHVCSLLSTMPMNNDWVRNSLEILRLAVDYIGARPSVDNLVCDRWQKLCVKLKIQNNLFYLFTVVAVYGELTDTVINHLTVDDAEDSEIAHSGLVAELMQSELFQQYLSSLKLMDGNAEDEASRLIELASAHTVSEVEQVIEDLM